VMQWKAYCQIPALATLPLASGYRPSMCHPPRKWLKAWWLRL
jgi:hypothetical protein